MENRKVLKLTQIAMFIAIITAMTFIPYIGYIVYGGLSITTIHIPVIIGAIFLGPAAGFILGLTWGVTCLVYAFMNGTADAVIFLNPLISVVPRIIVGCVTGWYFIFLSKIAPKIAVPLTALLGTLTNTVLVLGAIYIFSDTGLITLAGWVKNMFLVALGINGLVETGLAVFLATSICKVLFIQKERNSLI